jgi:cellulose synthase/poly-beta-1,6-N-acetylglucosamine synthase-like glycosyltransferase
MKLHGKHIDRILGQVSTLFLLTYIIIITFLLSGNTIFPSNGLFYSLLVAFLIDGVVIIIEAITKRQVEQYRCEPEKLTVIIPVYNGADSIEGTVKSVIRTLPGVTVLVVSDGSTDNSAQLARNAGAQVLELTQNIRKVAATNKALELVKTPYVLLIDDDVHIDGAKIPTSLLEKYDGVAFSIVPIGDKLVHAFQRHEYRKTCEFSRASQGRQATVPCVSGACGLYRKEVLIDQVFLHDGHFSGEDLQRTLLVHRRKGSRGIFPHTQKIYTHVPNTFGELYRQRIYGWWPGLYNNFKHYFALAFGKKTPGSLRFHAFYSIFLILTDPLRILSLPALLVNPEKFIVFYLFYVALEAVPYLLMPDREKPWVVFLAPFYGIFSLFTRATALFIWTYRTLAGLFHKNIADPYRTHAHPLEHWYSTVFALLLAFSMSYFGIYSNFAERFAEPVSAVSERFSGSVRRKMGIAEIDNTVSIQYLESITPCEYAIAEKKEKIYKITALQGDGFSLIARKAIAAYRNDVGGFTDPVHRLYAEHVITNELLSSYKRIQKGTTYKLSESYIRSRLQQGEKIDAGVYQKLQHYVGL